MDEPLDFGEGLRDRIDPDLLGARFTHREAYVALFEEHLRRVPPIPTLAYFGLAGCGKTYLLQYLFETYGTGWSDPPIGHPHAYINFRHGHSPLSTADALWS